MSVPVDWKQVWEHESKGRVSDFELDRGMSPRERETEELSEREILKFIDARRGDVVLDAGCGTGVNILRIHSQVKELIGIDFASGSIERCEKRISEHGITNAKVQLGTITAVPLPDRSVNRILCLSVLQYLNDDEVLRGLKELVRVLVPGGTLILHVKNSSSLYWSTLRAAKKLKSFLGFDSRSYYLRSFRWYVRQLEALNLNIVEYKSANVLSLEFMPKSWVRYLQGAELRNENSAFCRMAFVRRHGADLKIKACLQPPA